jgi:hypothetical protein
MYFQDHQSFEKSFEGSYPKFQNIQDLYDQRIDSLSKQLQVFFSEIENDEIFKAMQENSLSHEYASQRASELFTEIMKSEQESSIRKLQNELIEYKSLNMKLDYDIQRITKSLRETESEKESILKEYKNLEHELEENFKRKDAELINKLNSNIRRLEFALHETEQKYFNARKDLENVQALRETGEIMNNEIEVLRKELKMQENYNYRQLEDLKQKYEQKILDITKRLEEAGKENELISEQFRVYQKQSEDLASNHQTVIKNLLDKSKKFKQKILSQKSKLSEVQKISKEGSLNYESSKSNYEKSISDLEFKCKSVEREALARENEMIAKHQAQITQLQVQYQHMMDLKLNEMQRDVDEQISRSQEHDKEVKNLMEMKMKEIERDYITKTYHERLLSEKENYLNNKFLSKIEEINTKNTQDQNDLQRDLNILERKNEDLSETIENIKRSEDNLRKELLKEKERLGSDLNSKLIKLKETETSRIDMARDLESVHKELKDLKELYQHELSNKLKAEKEISTLNNTLIDLKNNLNQTKINLQSTKTQNELMLLEKVDKSQYLQEKDRSQYLELEVQNKSMQISRLEEEINSLHTALRENKLQRSGDLSLIELEQSRHTETKSQLQELQIYSQKLLNELDIRESQQNDLQSMVESYKEELRGLKSVIDNKEKEFFTFRQLNLNKEVDMKYKIKTITDKTKKYVKNSIFFLKKQLLGISELFEHEYSSINKNFSSVSQEISIKIIEMQLNFRKEIDSKAEIYSNEVKAHYRSRLEQIEELISQENVHWNDAETEGIRRAIKSIIEKKNIGQIEIKSLRESLNNANQQNEDLYRENQKLQIRLQANNEAFDQLQREVSEEANKIKLRLETGKDRTDRLDFPNRGYYRN